MKLLRMVVSSCLLVFGLSSVTWAFFADGGEGKSELSCNPIPTLEEISGSFYYNSTLMTVSQAASLKLPFLNAEGSRNQMVLVRDYARSVCCLCSSLERDDRKVSPTPLELNRQLEEGTGLGST